MQKDVIREIPTTNKQRDLIIYYTGAKRLMDNSPLVKFIRNYTRNPSGVFLVIFPTKDIDEVSARFFTVAEVRLHSPLENCEI